MNDLISREEAIALADKLKYDLTDDERIADVVIAHNEGLLEYQTVLSLLPSVQQRWKPDEWCTDCKEYDHERNCCPRFNRVIRKTLEEQQETGKWIIGTIPPSVGTHCDNCGWAWADHIDAVKLNKTLSLIKTRYCPNCGARMDGDDD